MEHLQIWGPLQEVQEHEWVDDDIDSAIIRTRNEEIRQIEEDVICLNDIFRDLALMVNDQGEQIDLAAEQTQQAVIGMLLKGALVFSGITVGGIGLAIISPIAGILTAGAGITGIVTTVGIALKKNK